MKQTGYKHETSGHFPTDWRTARLSELVEQNRPITYGIVQPGANTKGGVLMIRSQDYVGGWSGTSGIMRVSKIVEAPYERARVRTGDILITVVGANIGTLAIVPPELDSANISRAVARISAARNKIDPLFLLQSLDSGQIEKLISVATTGGAQPVLNISQLEGLHILLPPLPEQKAIASILSTWDSAIEKTLQLITQKELQMKALMQQLITGKKRLKGFDEKWRSCHIGEIASELVSKNGDHSQLVVLSCTKYDGLVPSLEYFGRKMYGNDLSTYKVVQRHTFAYATNHIEEGSIGYQTNYEQALISPMYTVFKTNGQENDEYLYRLLKSHKYIHEYRKRMEGSINRRGGLRWEEFSKIKLTLPSRQEQDAINEVLTTADKELKLLNQKLDLLKEQKRGLMQKLLTGQMRLRVKS